MSYQEMYEQLPYETQGFIDDYVLGLEMAEQCFTALIELCPEREAAVRALAEHYGVWEHHKQQALDELKKLGVDDNEAYKLGLGYYEKYKK